MAPLTESSIILYVSVPNEIKELYQNLQVDLLLGDGKNSVYSKEDILYYYLMNFEK